MSTLKALRPADQERLKNSWQKGQRSCTGKGLQGHSSSRTKLTGSYGTETGNHSSSTLVIALNFTRLHRRHGCARAASLPDSVQDFSELPCSFENSAYPSVSSTSFTYLCMEFLPHYDCNSPLLSVLCFYCHRCFTADI